MNRPVQLFRVLCALSRPKAKFGLATKERKERERTGRANGGSHRRFGTSLVEVLCAISVLTLVLALATGMIAQLQRTAGHAKQHAEGLQAVHRLADQFRSDVSKASAVFPKFAAPNVIGSLQLASGERVDYVQEENQVARMSFVEGKSPRRERYQLGPTKTTMTVDESPAHGAVAALLVSRHVSQASSAAVSPLRIEAAIPSARKEAP